MKKRNSIQTYRKNVPIKVPISSQSHNVQEQHIRHYDSHVTLVNKGVSEQPVRIPPRVNLPPRVEKIFPHQIIKLRPRIRDEKKSEEKSSGEDIFSRIRFLDSINGYPDRNADDWLEYYVDSPLSDIKSEYDKGIINLEQAEQKIDVASMEAQDVLYNSQEHDTILEFSDGESDFIGHYHLPESGLSDKWVSTGGYRGYTELEFPKDGRYRKLWTLEVVADDRVSEAYNKLINHIKEILDKQKIPWVKASLGTSNLFWGHSTFGIDKNKNLEGVLTLSMIMPLIMQYQAIYDDVVDENVMPSDPIVSALKNGMKEEELRNNIKKQVGEGEGSKDALAMFEGALARAKRKISRGEDKK